MCSKPWTGFVLCVYYNTHVYASNMLVVSTFNSMISFKCLLLNSEACLSLLSEKNDAQNWMLALVFWPSGHTVASLLIFLTWPKIGSHYWIQKFAWISRIVGKTKWKSNANSDFCVLTHHGPSVRLSIHLGKLEEKVTRKKSYRINLPQPPIKLPILILKSLQKACTCCLKKAAGPKIMNWRKKSRVN